MIEMVVVDLRVGIAVVIVMARDLFVCWQEICMKFCWSWLAGNKSVDWIYP